MVMPPHALQRQHATNLNFLYYIFGIQFFFCFYTMVGDGPPSLNLNTPLYAGTIYILIGTGTQINMCLRACAHYKMR